MSLTQPFIERTLVQAIPSVTPREYVGALAAGATRDFDFDVCNRVADPNRLLTGAQPTADGLDAVGPWLDAFYFSDQTGTLAVFMAISTGSFRQITSSILGASTPANISGLRITARFVRVRVTNTSVASASIEVGVYVRST